MIQMPLRPWMSVAAAVLGFFVILAWRIREGRTPVTLRKIIIPPLGMATGFCMFLAPPFRVPWTYATIAFLLGALLLAYPLIRSSRLTLQNGVVMVQRSRSFFVVLIALAVLRIAAHAYLDTIISVPQTAGLFFILAFGMVLRWRLSMLLEYRRLTTPLFLP
jgi:membrane protein CcdC involved in cytochrome C biogenesis